jgi:hypothetical protein
MEKWLDDGHGIFEPADAVIEWVAEHVVFGLMPPGAEPEDESTAADIVDRFAHLADQTGIAKTGACY